ncbi:MAG: YraN family protein [Candidatus Gastranaerophilales bacterium]|nr:YraN family protein [Candidatus Gastranaerophilales bacterium]
MGNNRTIGQNGEDIAAEYLKKKGYKIIERNIHFSRACEIDIIALDGKTLVCIEVKTRRTEFCGSPLEAITQAKYNNIRKGLYSYLSEHPEYKKFRIDAISVMLKPTVSIEHLENIYL